MKSNSAIPMLFEINKAKGMVAVLDTAGLITAASSDLLHFLLITKSQLQPLHFAKLAVTEEQEKAASFCYDVLAGTPVFGYLALAHTACTKKIVNLTMVPLLKDGCITGAYCFFKDVTETVSHNKRVHDNEQRLVAIFDTALECIKVTSPDGILTDINPAGLEMLGVASKEEVIGKCGLHFIHPDDQAGYVQLHRQVCRGQKGSLVYRICNRQQKMHWVETNAVPLKDKYNNIYATLSITRDISEKKQDEIKLHLSEQKFRSLVQSGSDLTFVIDEKGFVRYASPAVKEIAGYEPEDLLGKQALHFLHADEQALASSELQEIITSTNSGVATAHRFLTSSGQWIWLESKGTNLLNDNSVQGLVINSRDVTDRILLQQKLENELATRQRKITAAVIRAQECERSQLGQELHDNVNQVLTTVKLYNEMLAGDIGPREDILEKSTRYLQICIDEIRSISKRLSAPTLGQITLTDSVHELVDSINLTNKLCVHYTFQGFEMAAVSQDVHLAIYRIIQEQLNNIIKHAGAQHVFIEINNTSQHLALVIRDDGHGFDLQQKRRGIGITNMITRAENINGKLVIQSKPGMGCVLTVTLPPLNLCSN